VKNKMTSNILNKITFIIILFFSALLLVGCKQTPTPPNNADEDVDPSIFPEQFSGILYNKKIYITSFGQSIDIEDFTYQLESLSLIEYKRENMLNVDDVLNDSVVIMVVGSSLKALQEAGITVKEELSRAQRFFDKKESKNLTYISFHIGGKARRGLTSDSIIELVMSKTDLNIFFKDSNFDNKLVLFSQKNNVPMYQYEYVTQLPPTIRRLYENEDINNG